MKAFSLLSYQTHAVCVCVMEQSDRVVLLISWLNKLFNKEGPHQAVYSQLQAQWCFLILRELSLSVGYLHFGLVENIFAFINRDEGRSDVLYTVRNYFTENCGSFWL